MKSFLTLDDVNLKNKTVLLRADLNVPIQNGVVTDQSRIEALIPTLNELIKAEAKIVIISHFGRPDGKIDPKYSLRFVAQTMEKILNHNIYFADDCIGVLAADAIAKLTKGNILILENTRFHEGEEKNDPIFSQQLAINADLYINDAFSVSHRAHASTEGVTHFLPSLAGRLMQAEIEALEKSLINVKRPVTAIIGGSKISTKIELLQNLITKIDTLIIGGAMANTFIASQGINIGQSLYEPSKLDIANFIMSLAKNYNCNIILPKDVIIATNLKIHDEIKCVDINHIPHEKMILDIGDKSIEEISNILSSSQTVIWNGPLGAFEVPPFNKATIQIANCIANLTKNKKMFSIAGGGDTLAALSQASVKNDLSYVSTAGGAFLEWFEGKTLPGIKALEIKDY